MDDFFKSLLSGNTENPDQIFSEALLRICPEAVLVEWFIDGTVHEAIFVEHGQEKIARFSEIAKLTDIKTNLHISEVPEIIRKNMEVFGEIMSSVSISEDHKVRYEFVLRDKNMQREIIFTDEDGKIMHRKKFPEII